MGKLNYYIGKRAYDERGEGRFPGIDFCSYPEAICTEGDEGSEEIRWITGLFEWIERIQSYSGWDYISELQQFVDGGMTDETFFETVISIFIRDCHEPDCSSIELTSSEERKENFVQILQIFGLPETKSYPTLLPTEEPTTQMPSTSSPVKNILPPSLSLIEPSALQSSSTPMPTTTLTIAPTTTKKSSSPTNKLIILEGNFASRLVSSSLFAAITTIGLQVFHY
jgi:hypothetical protein